MLHSFELSFDLREQRKCDSPGCGLCNRDCSIPKLDVVLSLHGTETLDNVRVFLGYTVLVQVVDARYQVEAFDSWTPHECLLKIPDHKELLLDLPVFVCACCRELTTDSESLLTFGGAGVAEKQEIVHIMNTCSNAPLMEDPLEGRGDGAEDGGC